MKNCLIIFEKKKLNVNLHYIPVHLHPYYRKLGFKVGNFPESEKHAKTAISLPIYPNLKIKEVKKISNLINIFFQKKIVNKKKI